METDAVDQTIMIITGYCRDILRSPVLHIRRY